MSHKNKRMLSSVTGTAHYSSAKSDLQNVCTRHTNLSGGIRDNLDGFIDLLNFMFLYSPLE